MHNKDYYNKFTDVFRTYFPRVKAFIYSMLKSEVEAQDLAQDIFFKLWNQQIVLDNIKNLDAYLFRVAKNAIYNHIKHKQVEKSYLNHSKISTEEIMDGYKCIFANELADKLENVVSKMPPQRQKIFRLSREHGLSNMEISKKINLSKRTIDCHITLALAELKKIFGSISGGKN